MNDDIRFEVRENKKQVEVVWRIKNATTITDFLYWAFEHGTRYQLRVWRERPILTFELVPESGATAGEYTSGLLWDTSSGCLLRRFNAGLHYVTHHAFDGFPEKVFYALDHETQIIRVESSGGLFTLSLDEWFDYLSSGRNDRAISALGIKPSERET